MMIDDNQRDIDLAKSVLVDQCSINFNFISYINPIQAIKFLESKKNSPDAIILHFIIPVVDDIADLKGLRKISSVCDMQIVIHFSCYDYKNITKVINLNIYAFFEKPLNGEIFNGFITHWHRF